MVMPQAALTRSMTSGLSGSPALMSSLTRTDQADKSSWISMRHTVGGAQNVVMPQRAIVSRSPFALNRRWLTMKIVACAIHGEKKQLQACLAQPGDEMLRCTSPGRSPSQYIVERWPTG